MRNNMESTGAENPGARTTLASRLLMVVLALTLIPAFAAGPSALSAPPRNPQLASLQIEIWPEYDRPAALVILRGAIAADAKLPAEVTLRIPVSSGGPSALAYSAAEGGNLLTLEHQKKVSNEVMTLRFTVPERYFHVEFYESYATDKPERNYNYVWPGDMRIQQLRLIVQEPAAVSKFSVQPNLDTIASGQDGLRYRSAELGAQDAGKQLQVKLGYTKIDTRTSTQILQPKKTGPAPAPAAATGSSEEVTKGVLVFILALSLLIGIATAFMWWRGRDKTPAVKAGAAGACTKCGTPRAAEDRFCSNCGTRLQ